MVQLASCNHDEKGGLGWEGGVHPGDQTGNEVSILQYNTWDPSVWTGLYRAQDPGVHERIGQAGIQMCRNDHIGYNQADRYSFVNELLKTGNIDLINVDCNTDCSAGTCACTIVAGYSDFPRDLRTNIWDTRVSAYKNADGFGFDVYKDPEHLRQDKFLRSGDILLKDGHVVIVVSDGSEADAPNTKPLYVLECTRYTSVRVSPSEGSSRIAGCPYLGEGNKVDYCDQRGDWTYVRIINKWGWVKTECLERWKDPNEIHVGDEVHFSGGNLYTSSYAAGRPVQVPAFDGVCRQLIPERPHSYYIKGEIFDGWADDDAVFKR